MHKKFDGKLYFKQNNIKFAIRMVVDFILLALFLWTIIQIRIEKEFGPFELIIWIICFMIVFPLNFGRYGGYGAKYIRDVQVEIFIGDEMLNIILHLKKGSSVVERLYYHILKNNVKKMQYSINKNAIKILGKGRFSKDNVTWDDCEEYMIIFEKKEDAYDAFVEIEESMNLTIETKDFNYMEITSWLTHDIGRCSYTYYT